MLCDISFLLWHGMVSYAVLWRVMKCYEVSRYDMISYGALCYAMYCYDMLSYVMVVCVVICGVIL